ncbi:MULTISPECIES: serine/threonine-protein kinase [Micromonospora]|uniref:non-specific serine/threonine protein kinase n=1 Tax=Micromonospora chalcea TaxID=1874 RepID=A0ABX9Y3F1_MICCH|nr:MULTISPECIES: serine/threonine-protein kinase [Micromonospora]MBQ1062098.1 serine/threonine protein kinase [Micromonospora sp. C41]MBQ1065587.1 serine/threonine protein kinase [Micromonospora sp. D75]MCK1808197.1 serine/threonine protein kinase [Micromonospora sp. R42106]MCK1833003.1 serine/threonine protein kinase [Micromonospora sp. R42003]MCK1844676.1 serine/threonine protein kinase [Micromonospora sp. R42004]
MTETPPGAVRLPIVPGLTDLQVFARGGYATIYRATQISVGREVAVKIENRTLDSERDQARFLREARAAGRMSSHPHVVDLFDVGVTVDQHPYLIMELCDGSYAERMRTSPLGPEETRDLGVKIADALAHSHAAGVLHRDVKPANILHSEFNSAVLADFGLAVLAEFRDSSVMLEALTPAYAPPETFNHSPPSPAVDVYSLCATLYAVMYGRPPRWHSERNPSLVTVLEMFQQPIPGLPGVPGELIDVLRLGMSNDPGARPSAVELRGLLAGLPLDGAPAGGALYDGAERYRRSGGPNPRPPADDDHPTVASRARRWPKRWFLGGAGVLALAASAGGGWLAAGHTPAAPPTPVTSGVAGGPVPGCASADVRLPAGARCASELECFGPVRLRRDRAEASRVPCDGQHTWETYAAGDLPAGLAGAKHDAVVADPAVGKVCNPDTFRVVSGADPANGWNLEVLPPETDADRTYRCLAGRGVNALAGPTLTGR